MIEFTTVDMDRAHGEGWYFRMYRHGRGPFIGRWQIHPRSWEFTSDKHAYDWVCMKADRGSEFHQRAIAYLVMRKMEARESEMRGDIE